MAFAEKATRRADTDNDENRNTDFAEAADFTEEIRESSEKASWPTAETRGTRRFAEVFS